MILDRHLNDEIDGLEAARRIRQRQPHQAIVIASGEEAMPEDDVPPDVTWLLKPYGLGLVARAVQRAVATTEKRRRDCAPAESRRLLR